MRIRLTDSHTNTLTTYSTLDPVPLYIPTEICSKSIAFQYLEPKIQYFTLSPITAELYSSDNPHLDSQVIVLEIAVPGRDRQLSPRGNHALHPLRKLLGALPCAQLLRRQEEDVADHRPARHQPHLRHEGAGGSWHVAGGDGPWRAPADRVSGLGAALVRAHLRLCVQQQNYDVRPWTRPMDL